MKRSSFAVLAPLDGFGSVLDADPRKMTCLVIDHLPGTQAVIHVHRCFDIALGVLWSCIRQNVKICFNLTHLEVTGSIDLVCCVAAGPGGPMTSVSLAPSASKALA